MEKKYKCFCGNDITKEMLYCSNCGKKLDVIFSDPQVCIELAKKYSNYENVAYGYYWEAASYKNPEAMYNLGLFIEKDYKNSYILFKGKKRENYEKCFIEAAKLNYGPAILKLQELYPDIKNTDGLKIVESIIQEKKRIEEERLKQARAAEMEQKKQEELKKQADLLEKERIAKEEAAKEANEHREFIEEQKKFAMHELRSVEKKINSLISEFLDCRDLSRESLLIFKIKELLNYKVSLWEDDEYEYKYLYVRKEKIYDYPGYLKKVEEVLEEKKRIDQIEKKKRDKLIEEQKNAIHTKLSDIENNLSNLKVYNYYYDTWGEGVITNFEWQGNINAYINVFFEKLNETKRFPMPDALDKGQISFSNNWREKPDDEKTYKDFEYKKEKDYHSVVLKRCEEYINAEYKAATVYYNYNPRDEFYDPQTVADDIENATKKDFWRSVSNDPYFGSIKTTKDGTIYIGKQQIDELVMDYRDPIFKIYYQYNVLIGNKDLGICLVRDHIIHYHMYKDFIDKYNVDHPDDMYNDSTDKYLVRLLEYSRKSKETHDIIQTIQSNQYEIISSNSDNNIVVNGCAGSGKTMVLFHKIAYNAFNDKKYSSNSICVLSSSKLLKKEALVLGKELGINDIHQYETYEFYKLFVNNYIKDYNSTYLLKDDNVNNEINNSIYDNNKLDSIYRFVNDYLKHSNGEYDLFVKNDLILKFKTIFPEKKCNDSIEEIIRFFETSDFIDSYFTTIKKVPYRNLLAYNENEIPRSIKVFIERNFGDYLSKRTVYYSEKSQRRGEVKENKVESVDALIRLIFKEHTDYSNISLFNNINNYPYLIKLYDIITYGKYIRNYIDYINGNYKGLLINVISYVLSKNEEYKDLNSNNLSFVLAYLLARFGIKFKYSYKDIYVDEYQNYSLSEFEFFDLINPAVRYSLFGDAMQKIETKGIKSYKDLPFGNFKEYSLMINYRNSFEVCEFLNRKFNLSMIPVGVHGTVSIEKDLKFTIDEENDRTVIIYKGKNELINDKVNFHHITLEDPNFDRSRINIIDVSLVKGLEFEKVYVLPNGMSENELYLSYSRALNHLVVIE